MTDDPDGLGCENLRHEAPVLAVASVHLIGSDSAANSYFACGDCLNDYVKDVFVAATLGEPRIPFEVWPL